MGHHFIPKQLLRGFAQEEKIWTYNPDTQRHDNVNIKSAFQRPDLYTDEVGNPQLEQALNESLEQRFYPILDRILTSNIDSISLSRNELFEIKRFILAELFRIPYFDYTEDELSAHYEMAKQFIQAIYPNKKYKDIGGLNSKGKMLNDLKVILRQPFDKIIEDVDCSHSLAKLQTLLQSAYLGFWRANNKNDFIIADRYVINERDLPANKVLFINSLIEKYYGIKEYEKEVADLIANFMTVTNFTENVWFFPVASDLMIVLINPFFKQINPLVKKHFQEFNNLSNINIKYYQSNKVNFHNKKMIDEDIAKNQAKHIAHYYHDNDQYLYQVQGLDDKTIHYVNSLMLNEVNRYLGYKNKEKIIQSVEYYISYPAKKNKDYMSLLNILKA